MSVYIVINPWWPFIGTTSDGIVTCMCCGKGALDINCTYCHWGESIKLAAEDKNFRLKRRSDGMLCLDPQHAHYYQIQTQLFVCDVEYCDFCLCTFTGDESGLHIEHVYKDTCLWSDCVARAKFFFWNLYSSRVAQKMVYKAKKPENLHTFLKQ